MADQSNGDALPVAALGPATPAAALEVVSYLASSRAAVAALEVESSEATAALAAGPDDVRRAEELRDRVASAAAELSSTEARTRDALARAAALRARRDALAGRK